jgi:hypothetical protein
MNAPTRRDPSPLVGEGGPRSGSDEGSRRALHPSTAPSLTAVFADSATDPSSVGQTPDTFSHRGRRVAWGVTGALAAASFTLAGCEKPDPLKHVVDQLSGREGHPVVVVTQEQERRDGHDVICGIFQQSGGKTGLAKRFSSVDGKLVMKWGPDVNPGTLCLQRYFGMPLI